MEQTPGAAVTSAAAGASQAPTASPSTRHNELCAIEARLSALEEEAEALRARRRDLLRAPTAHDSPPLATHPLVRTPFTSHDLLRYSRQMLVPSFGPYAHLALSSLRVLVVGAGGLGCPLALYLAAAGVGSLTVVDDDRVDSSNLHRQIAHTESRIGWEKARSLVAACEALNGGGEGPASSPPSSSPPSSSPPSSSPSSSNLPHPRYRAVAERFTHRNALSLLSECDVVVDCTDNPTTRYLLNDAAVLAGGGTKPPTLPIPIVSGAALGTDGQLSVYHYSPDSQSTPGPCYRCLFPVPPAAAAVPSCSDAGVLGPVTGVIGALQALEVMKIAAQRAKIAGASSSSTQHTPALPTLGAPLAGSLLLFDGSEGRFRCVRGVKGGRDAACAVCGDAPTIRSLEDTKKWCIDMGLAEREGEEAAQLCPCEETKGGARGGEGGGLPSVDASTFLRALADPASHPPRVIDVREPHQFAMMHLRDTVNVPLAALRRAASAEEGEGGARGASSLLPPPAAPLEGSGPLYVLCRRGIDSVEATSLLLQGGMPSTSSSASSSSSSLDGSPPVVVNVEGGLVALGAAVRRRRRSKGKGQEEEGGGGEGQDWEGEFPTY